MAYFHRDFSSPDSMLEIANNRRSSAVFVHLFGFNETIGDSFEHIGNGFNAPYAWPGSALTMSVVSSSASDTGQVLISGLDANYESIFDVVTLNGTTPVTTTNQFFRINQAYTLGAPPTGNISITNASVTYAYIAAGLGTDQSVHYTVPAGKNLVIHQVNFTSGTVNPNKYLVSRACTVTSTGTEHHFWQSTFQQDIAFNLHVPFVVREKTDFSIEAKSSSGENELAVYIGAVLMEDGRG